MRPVHRSPTQRAHGVLAWFLAGLVFTLGVLTVAPTLHAHLHHDAVDAHGEHAAPQPHDDHGCAVTLFQHGITLPLDPPVIGTPRVLWIATPTPARAMIARSAPRHLLRPARGPPCSG